MNCRSSERIAPTGIILCVDITVVVVVVVVVCKMAFFTFLSFAHSVAAEISISSAFQSPPLLGFDFSLPTSNWEPFPERISTIATFFSFSSSSNSSRFPLLFVSFFPFF